MDYKKVYSEWRNANLSDEINAELVAIEGDDAAIKDRFFGDLEFRTAGMRGVLGAGTLRMNYLTVNRATKGLSDYISSLGSEAKKSGIVIAYDTRRYSFEFALSSARVLSANGIRVFLFEDARPVPMCSFAVRHLKAAAGIVITASHNPKEYNGYKVYGADGAQMGVEATERVVEYIKAAGYFPKNNADGAQPGVEATERVVEYIKAAGYFPKDAEKNCGNCENITGNSTKTDERNDGDKAGYKKNATVAGCFADAGYDIIDGRKAVNDGDDGREAGYKKNAAVDCSVDTAGYDIIEKRKVGKAFKFDLGGLKACDIKGKDGFFIDENIEVIGKSVDEAYYSEIAKLALSKDAVSAVGGSLKLVYTPLHGSGYIPVTTVLKRTGINVEVVEEQKNPDFDFSTVSVPNPEQPDALRLGIALAEKIGADVVLGTDPDCDRMGAAIKTEDGYELLTGNQIGALLLDYILARKTASETLPKNAAAVKTIVTTELAAKIARAYDTDIVDVLTGFKFIGEKIKEWEQSGEKTFIFGYEESYGYLAGTHARDKDAVVAAMLFSEALCYYKYTGTSVLERLNYLYGRFGYFVEKSMSIAYKGADAMNKMSETMAALRTKKVFDFEGASVGFIDDYIPRERLFENGEKCGIDLPQTDVLYYGLKGGGFVCVRPSGTEPKLKIYVSVSAPNKTDAAEFADKLLKAAAEKL
jgi:phosphomannomutase